MYNTTEDKKFDKCYRDWIYTYKNVTQLVENNCIYYFTYYQKLLY